MKLILIRHAQSLRNIRIGGHTFYNEGEKKIGLPNYRVPITEEGERQALLRARFLYEMTDIPTVMIHSGFMRTVETTRIIKNEIERLHTESGRVLRIPVEQNHLLRERDAGHAFEMNVKEVAAHFPYLDEYWKLDGTYFAVPPGGESFIQVMDRISLFLSQLTHRKDLENSTVYAVTHGGTMRAFQLVIESVPYDHMEEMVRKPENCEAHTYTYKEGVWFK
jgi:2,3-bisphosphoglycerate-dependent phosphoglycerate mutase